MKVNHLTQNTPFKKFYTQRQNIEKRFEAANHKKQDNIKRAVAAASFLGAAVPIAIYNIKKGNLSKIKDVFQNESSTALNKIKAATDIIEVENIKQIGASVAGSILAGVGAGAALDKNPENRKEKYKEGVYGFFNCMVPMSIITGAEALAKAKGINGGVLGKAATVAAGIAGGMLLSNKISNEINKTFFKDNKKDFEERKIKPSDALVHVDDIAGLLVISKVPFAQYIGKALPFIYGHVGLEAGTKTKNNDRNA